MANMNKHSGSKTVLILAACFILVLAGRAIFGRKPANRLQEAITPLIRESLPSSPGAEVPADPAFVFYDMDEKRVAAPDPAKYPQGTDDPEKVNVIVAFRQVFQGRQFYLVETHENVIRQVRTLNVYVIRADDWSLIARQSYESRTVTEKPEYTHYSNDLTYDARVFINDILSGKADEPQPDTAEPMVEAPAG